jgi:hypothetical protein
MFQSRLMIRTCNESYITSFDSGLQHALSFVSHEQKIALKLDENFIKIKLMIYFNTLEHY